MLNSMAGRGNSIMKNSIRAALLTGALAFATGAAPLAALGETQMPVSLFKVVTAKDEVIIGLNSHELRAPGGPEKAPAAFHSQAAKHCNPESAATLDPGIVNGKPPISPAASLRLFSRFGPDAMS
jgi:hypothetical protein